MAFSRCVVDAVEFKIDPYNLKVGPVGTFIFRSGAKMFVSVPSSPALLGDEYNRLKSATNKELANAVFSPAAAAAAAVAAGVSPLLALSAGALRLGFRGGISPKRCMINVHFLLPEVMGQMSVPLFTSSGNWLETEASVQDLVKITLTRQAKPDGTIAKEAGRVPLTVRVTVSLDERAAENALLSSLGEYREADKFVDMTLTGKEGASAKAHAAVMASAVPAVLAKLTGGWSGAAEFNVGDLNANQLRLFVNFCYSRDVAVLERASSTDLKQLLKVSGELVATDMFDACDVMLSHWCARPDTSIRKISSCHKLATQHGASNLKDKCVLTIFRRRGELLTEELMRLCNKMPELFAMVAQGGGAPPPRKKARVAPR